MHAVAGVAAKRPLKASHRTMERMHSDIGAFPNISQRLLWILALCALSTLVKAQTPGGYSFKGNYLGESLREFKAANATAEVSVNTGKPKGMFGHPDKKLTTTVKTPLCTDQMRGFPGDPGQLVPDEVACNVSPGEANPDGLVIGGNKARTVLYRFYKEKLYRIDISISDAFYPAVSQAFREKYGEPAKVLSHEYQNGYGARWNGEILAWKAGGQGIIMLEGPGNGPGQNRFMTQSTIMMGDTALEPESNSKSPVDF